MSKPELARDWGKDDPVIRAFIHNQASDPRTFSTKVHPADEMLLFDSQFTSNSTLALLRYFITGHKIFEAMRQLLQWRFGGFSRVSTLLDMACGYGRVTRFLVQALPPDRIWSADIYSEAVAFQQQEFGVHGVQSVREPSNFTCDRRFDCIFVTSLFSHLPEETFIPWLRALYRLLAPNGMLAISVHDEDLIAGAHNPEMPAGGILYLPFSESKSLAHEDYGTTFVTESFVHGAVSVASGGTGAAHRIPKGIANHQDIYVVVDQRTADFTRLAFDHGPTGYVDSCVLVDEQLELGGWAAVLNPTAHVEAVQILVDGHLQDSGVPFLARPDVAAALHDDRFLESGWVSRCSLGSNAVPATAILTVRVVGSNGLSQVIYNDTLAAALRLPGP